MSNWQHHFHTNDELKEIVRDVYDCKIFTSLHLGANSYITSSVFMPYLFLGSKPSFPSKTENNQLKRKNKLNHINEIIEYEEETPIREEYFKNIGMLYEYNENAGPTSINGYPIFVSMRILSKEDTIKFIDMYSKYVEMRKEFEKEW